MDYSKLLRKHMEEKHLNAYQLSKLTGISQSHISDLVNGKNNPSLDTVVRLIEPFGITLLDFFNEDSEEFYLSDDEKEIVHNFRTMTDEKSEAFLKLSKLLNK